MTALASTSANERVSNRVLSLQEKGTARLVFAIDMASFEGVLINEDESVYSLVGQRSEADSKELLCNVTIPEAGLDRVLRKFSDSQPSNLPYIKSTESDSGLSTSSVATGGGCEVAQHNGNTLFYDVTVVDGETGTEYFIRNVLLETIDPEQSHLVSLRSENLNFRTNEVMIGNRAEVEIRNYMNPAVLGSSPHDSEDVPKTQLHIGKMAIDVQTALTPPPTPCSINVDNFTDVHMDDDCDFFK